MKTFNKWLNDNNIDKQVLDTKRYQCIKFEISGYEVVLTIEHRMISRAVYSAGDGALDICNVHTPTYKGIIQTLNVLKENPNEEVTR